MRHTAAAGSERLLKVPPTPGTPVKSFVVSRQLKTRNNRRAGLGWPPKPRSRTIQICAKDKLLIRSIPNDDQNT
jgi:hypothetical protein